jgi:hypothetical protein
MIEKINCQDLIVLIAVLFIVFYFTTIFKKENFDNISDMKTINRKNKTCSQDSINTTIKDYIFSTLPSTR